MGKKKKKKFSKKVKLSLDLFDAKRVRVPGLTDVKHEVTCPNCSKKIVRMPLDFFEYPGDGHYLDICCENCEHEFNYGIVTKFTATYKFLQPVKILK